MTVLTRIIRLLYPELALTASLFYVSGVLISSLDSGVVLGLETCGGVCVTGFVLFLLYIAGSIIDHIGDFPYDKEAHRDNILLYIRKEVAIILVGSLYLISVLLAYLFSMEIFFIAVITTIMYIGIAVLYSLGIRLSDRSILGNISFVSFTYVIPYLLGVYMSVRMFSLSVILIGVNLLLISLSINVLRDLYDTNTAPRKNLVELLGSSRAVAGLSKILLIIAWALSLVTTLFLSRVNLLVLTLSLSLYILFLLAFNISGSDEEILKRVKKHYKKIYLFHLLIPILYIVSMV